MLDFAVYLLSSAGWAMMINSVSARIPLLNRKPFTCALCMGFWAGLAIAWIMGIPSAWMYAGASAAFAWGLNRMITGDF